MKKRIKLFDPVIDSAEKKAILEVLNSRFWASGSGSGHVLKFENKFKKYIQSKSCVAVNSGTSDWKIQGRPSQPGGPRGPADCFCD